MTENKSKVPAGDVESVVPERIWIDWANVDARIFYYVQPTGIEAEAVEYVPRSKLDVVRVELGKADNEIVGYQEKLREQQSLMKRHELDFNDLIESGAEEVRELKRQLAEYVRVSPSIQDTEQEKSEKLVNEEEGTVVSQIVIPQDSLESDWVVCGMDEAFPCRVSLTFASEDDAYAYYSALIKK